MTVTSNSIDSAWTLTDPFHKSPYAAISPLRPELNQNEKTILITGGNSGIGYAIASAFAQASAHKVIVTGRRAEATKTAASEIAAENVNVEVIGISCDMSDARAVDEMWGSLEKQGISVDVLVLNAVGVPSKKPILEDGTEAVWQALDINVRAQLQMTERFYKQVDRGASRQKVSN